MSFKELASLACDASFFFQTVSRDQNIPPLVEITWPVM